MKIRGLRVLKPFLGLLAAVFLGLGCAHTVVVEVPPKIDLAPYGTIGIVEFSSGSGADLDRIATRKFMEFVQNAQPRVRLLELGPEGQLARKLGRDSLDLEAVRAIEAKYGVSAVFTGSCEISHMKPEVRIGTQLSSLHASAAVNVSMTSRLRETGSGATVWTGSRQGQWKVAGLDASGKNVSFGMSSPEDRYGRYLEELAFAITDPFRSHRVKRKVSR